MELFSALGGGDDCELRSLVTYFLYLLPAGQQQSFVDSADGICCCWQRDTDR